jgi:hypothetical protein
MDSFNVYRQTSETIGGNAPVWLGTEKPIPVGATYPTSLGEVVASGIAVIYNAEDKTIQTIRSLGGGMEAQANAFLYNDIYSERGGIATAAIVMHHPEGLLIERVYPEITEEQIAQLQAKIPGVLLVRG